MSKDNLLPLNQMITLQRGFDLPASKRIEGDIPVVASTGIAGFHNEPKVKAPGVVIGRSGSIGGGQYIKTDFFPLNTTLYVKDFKGHNPKYIYYLLKSIDFKKFNVGTGVPTLNRNHLCSILIKQLSSNEEDKIAFILGSLDDKIQLNTDTNRTLEHIAQAVFQHWFIDFAPVRAKAQARAQGKSAVDIERAAMMSLSGKTADELTALATRNPTAYTDLQTLAAAFPDELTTTEQGEVPKGWEFKKIGDVIQKIPVGKKYSQKNTFPTGKIPVLDQGRSGIIGYHNDEAGVQATIEDPVIVFANHTCYMRLIHHSFSAIQNVFAFKGKNIDTYWFYLATLGKQEFVEYKGHFPDFLIKEIIVPNKELIALFGEMMKTSFEQIAIRNQENEMLVKTRDLLLPELLNGEWL